MDRVWQVLAPDVPELELVASAASDARPDLSGALELARDLTDRLPTPGAGQTAQLLQALAQLGAIDLTVARTVEPHLDAQHILAQAGDQTRDVPRDGTWGVFAAEGPGVRLEAVEEHGGWVLRGRKPWCSLASVLDRALVTAWVSPTERRLFAVDLHRPEVQVAEEAWVPKGLSDIDSGPVDFDNAPALPVGEAGWYLQRPGFAWGGIGVAAVWYGGAVGIAQRVVPRPGREPDQLALAHLGTVDTALYAARAALLLAAHEVDSGGAAGAKGAMLALRVRSVVATAAERILRTADHALGPAPLATEPAYADRVADLHLYLRQWHAERDAAALGKALLSGDAQ